MVFALYSSLRSVCVEKSPEPTESIRTMKFSRGTGRAASMQATTSPKTASPAGNLHFLLILQGCPSSPFSKDPLLKEIWALAPREDPGPDSALLFFLEGVLQMYFCHIGKSELRIVWAAREPVDYPC